MPLEELGGLVDEGEPAFPLDRAHDLELVRKHHRLQDGALPERAAPEVVLGPRDRDLRVRESLQVADVVVVHVRDDDVVHRLRAHPHAASRSSGSTCWWRPFAAPRSRSKPQSTSTVRLLLRISQK